MSAKRCEMKDVVKERRLVTTAAMFVNRAMDPGGVCRQARQGTARDHRRAAERERTPHGRSPTHVLRHAVPLRGYATA
eukprot:9345748-Heterocapsa_arctica.AAC.1